MKKAEIVSKFERSTLMEEVSWRQNSRILGLKEGSIVIKKRRGNDQVSVPIRYLISRILYQLSSPLE
jgi:hypothetical protein